MSDPSSMPEHVTVACGGVGSAATRTPVSPDRGWTIGRAGDADIVVPDTAGAAESLVSRRHLVLEHVGDGWVVRDVSSNGTWCDGVRLGREPLRVPPGVDMQLRLGASDGPQVTIASAPALAGPVIEPARPERRPRSRHRGLRRLGIALAVLLVLLAIADRVAAHVASTEAVSQIVQKSQGLADRPSVSFGGFPFLTQVAFGNYTDIHVGISNISPAGSPRIEKVSAHLRGAHVPLSTVINGDLKTIPVDHIRATVAMRYTDLNAFLADQTGHLKLANRHGAVQVTGTIDQGGQTFRVSGSAKLGVDSDGLVITPTSLHVTTGGPLDDILGGAGDALGDLVSAFPPVPVPLPGLPFHLRLTSVHSDDNGLVASGAADHVVLPAG